MREVDLSCNGRRCRGISSGMVEEDGGGWVADGEGWGGEGVLAPAVYEWGNGGGEEGGNHVFRARLSQMRGNLQT